MKKKKNIMQTLREIRDRQSAKYYKHPALLKKDLEKIRKKYRLKTERTDELAGI